MGLFRNIKESIDDRSSMSTGSITLLISAIIGAIIGLCVCFVLIYDVTYDGKVDTNLLDLGIFLMSGGGYILGSGLPKTIVDSRLKLKLSLRISMARRKRSLMVDIMGVAMVKKRMRKRLIMHKNIT